MLLYRALAALVLTACAPWALLRRFLGKRRLGDLRGRFGRTNYPDLSGGIWIHAVSVGEIGVARNCFARSGSGSRPRRSASEKLRTERKEVKLFYRGFDPIDGLKGRCRAETGHEAPKQPKFSERVMAKRKAGKAA